MRLLYDVRMHISIYVSISIHIHRYGLDGAGLNLAVLQRSGLVGAVRPPHQRGERIKVYLYVYIHACISIYRG